ncbi:similar to Saccharomyces cerevisiae YCL057W PRD1 Zinc metalloendopeptidase, found in the cytoplasm and intermembrane space of mitochondria [Maudiozyma barnettii]|uniref:Similar to Saccharomyces cerevisiae YCL057W PRD1 Zinc metalloendopeptidase, found in the cytoplasm and intermembrane space of mitochondria n=1 Tax=Maudiozyma barnettii TaxID=61262 RepID=A0A8H2VED0_9SACH|nr:metalloendopeptidase [Kazachstania barnettii]CAB4253351.1 similar to Saccharomyces cerevisiae YCL057W PRD1 Zinc metalloendopeptidase, found in the cytoplasm and intermembrane space of mitochondria [Kazachstania barnettii]CAD1780894.1 similar to Saccharomyces cerevisiae YCL057W PRD1 Zinc metalloendopeptidase, found in the cytoplasm and intermembrane space of mitochondria [Kazachstania barnettii]
MFWKSLVSVSSTSRLLLSQLNNKNTIISALAIGTGAIFFNQHNFKSTVLGINHFSTMTAANSSKFIAPSKPSSWNWSPKRLIFDAECIIQNANNLFDKLAAIENPDIGNFVKPFFEHENRCGPLVNQLCFLQHVSANKEIRDASIRATELLQDFEIEASLRYDLFTQMDKIWKEISPTKDEFVKAKPENFEIYKFIEKCHKDYVRDGLNLPKDKRDQVKDVKKKLASNSLQFSTNLGEQKEFIAFTKEELDGVSATVMEQFEKFTELETGIEKFKVTFKYPDIFPVLKTANNPETRRLAFNADQNKVPQNEKLFKDTLKLRDELSSLLGYATYANYNLEIKMAKNQETVLEFLTDLKDRLKPLGKKEIDILKELKKKNCEENDIPYDNHYYIWDHRYYDNKYLKDNYNVDLEKISDYYPVESTIKGMLGIYETLLKLRFIEETDVSKKNVWHPDVKQLAVWKMDDPENPEFVGWIYFDLHPRDGKYGHAANFGISSSFVDENGNRSYPVTALVCNFSKSTATKPSLLKHNEITTFFHELGHGIHDLVGKNKLSRFNGPGATPWDFVEAPSQMLEFWTWNKQELLSLSSHYKTGEKIPEELLDSLIRTKHVNGALFALRQLHFGLFDMKVHTNKDLSNLELEKLWNESRQEICFVETGSEYTKGYDSFGHIMSDSYSAGYYGYMWAEVFATDMYYTKFLSNPLDSTVGVQYRDIVLANGGLYEINDKLTEFLGRPPKKDAFLKELGISN